MAQAGTKSKDKILKENNWQQVKDIFQEALERPATEREQFLNEACRGDADLKDEICELLNAFNEDDSFFESAAIEELAGFIVESDELLKDGARLGRYKIKSELGAGGMGRVFLAEDTELGRLVAIKILSPIFSNDDKGIRRFIQEARSASALNHPNILTIHEIGQFERLHFIATEYVKGKTLRQRIKQKNLNLYEILEIALQSASALNAAHEAGIIHRDIKPENIMLRDADGLVKVLDFGLAKLVEKNQEVLNGEITAPSQIDTVPGLIMGTVAYMSPEQARGKATDARTDIWSLGVCLYEMLTGFKPFAGETNSDIIASVLRSEPPAFNITVVPAVGLNRIIQKALHKKPENRYQTAKDLIVELKDLLIELNAKSEIRRESGLSINTGFNYPAITGNALAGEATREVNQGNTTPVIEGKSHTKNTGLTLTFALLLLFVVTAGVLYYFIPTNHQIATFETMQFTKLTYTGNLVGEGLAITPDGKYIVYIVQQEEGKQSLWVKHLPTSRSIEIVPPAKVQYGAPVFSRDGNYVYYPMMENKGSAALYRVPVLGGEPKKLLDNVARPVTFSPDGARMAFVSGERLLMTANASDGSDAQSLAEAPGEKRWNLAAWSPDGKSIVATAFSPADNNTYLVEVTAENGNQKNFDSPPWLRISGIEWLPDAKGLILSGRDLEMKLSQLWRISYPEGKVQRVTNDLNTYLGLSLTADGKTIASIQYERLSNIWSVSGANKENDGSGGAARQITFEKDKDEGLSGVAVAPDGNRVVYTTRIAGVQDLWIVNADGSGNRQLTSNTRSNFSPAVSPDNRYIVFVSDRAGSSSIWRMDFDGGNQKQLTRNPGIAAFPGISPDGKWIIYQFTDSSGNKPTIWKVGIEGDATPVQLTDVYSLKPAISPDGNFFACYYGEPMKELQTKIAVIPFSGGKPAQLLDLPFVSKAPNFRWTSNGRGFIYPDNVNRVYNLWSQSLDNSLPRQLTNFNSEEIFRFDVANGSGRNIALARGHESSDVITIDNFK
jgi:serine/threonine protein kinase